MKEAREAVMFYDQLNIERLWHPWPDPDAVSNGLDNLQT